MSLRTFSARIARAYRPTYSRIVPAVSYRLYATKHFTRDHEWISVEGDIGTVGITEYAQTALGDVVFVEIPPVGKTVAKNAQIGAVESVKAASDIYAPVSGKIVEVNSKLSSEPSLINEQPEGDGWLAKIKLSDKNDLHSLLDKKAYTAHCEEADDH
ncbi:glycine cleavage system H protein [Endogone sp. FLAS-F59071]|nr:glycine cleavage system H protein [Endogone sp. FLAS-F59071]|eukprot:RUS15557.1 glycine cleavage system H protein [Endogone sp. FLAS-F59071]